MRRLFLAAVATLMLAACSSHDTAGTTGAGGAAAGYGQGGVGAASLAGGGGAGSGQLAPGVPDRVLFATARSTLSPEARGTLEKQAAWLQQNPRIAVQVSGNCDERGTEEYNLALGQRRSTAARDYLVSRGVQASRINAISYGKDRPVALGSTPDAWTQNRNAITSQAQ
jgi:peptidoglycan-associated lipoprotein